MVTRKKTGAGKRKIKKVMHEYKHGDLKSSSGKKVTRRKQAVAIALSEARAAGARIPKKKKTAKTAAKPQKTTRKKAVTRTRKKHTRKKH